MQSRIAGKTGGSPDAACPLKPLVKWGFTNSN